MSNLPLENENPFDYAARIVLAEDSLFLLKRLESHFSLSSLEAKSVWLSCPVYQEQFSRRRIKASQARGGSEYGNKVFLRKRFKLEGKELDQIFEDFWLGDNDSVSKIFMERMSPLRIAKGHLTRRAQVALEKLATNCGLS